jgi:hypothetical protein
MQMKLIKYLPVNQLILILELQVVQEAKLSVSEEFIKQQQEMQMQ